MLKLTNRKGKGKRKRNPVVKWNEGVVQWVKEKEVRKKSRICWPSAEEAKKSQKQKQKALTFGPLTDSRLTSM